MTLSAQDKPKPGKMEKKAREMCVGEILDELNRLGRQGVDVVPLLSELHKKFAMSFSALVFVLIGVPLAIKTHRGEKSIGLGISLGVLVIYWVLLAGGSAMALKGAMPPWLALWLPDMIISSAGLCLLYNVSRR